MFQIYNTPIFAYRLLAAFGLLVISASAQAQNVIINEVSNGASGSKEFVEFLVIGTCGQTADIRGWYFDDNCAPSPTGVGTAPGNARFANVAQWAAIPVGSLIVIYNPADKNAAIPADDPTDADCDLVYILPLSNSGLEVRGSAVGGCGSSNYTATTGYGAAIAATGWGFIGLANSGDMFQIRNASGVLEFSVSYGGVTTSATVNFGAVSGGGSCFNFNAGSDPFAVANWSATTTAATKDSPGKGNSCANAVYIEALRSVKDTEFKVSGCPNISATSTTLCPNATAAKALTGCVSSNYAWSSSNTSVVTVSGTMQAASVSAVGAGSANIIATVTQTYTSLFTGLSGCSATDIVKTITYPFTVNTPPTLTLTPSCVGGAGTGILTPVYTAGTGGSASYNTSILSALPNATYTVQVTESGSGCTTTAVATINCSVLPVKLLKFAVAKEANIHLLTWLTASEQNVSHFEVEYSSDGIFFEMISKQQAAGESTTLKTYFFEQQQAQTGRSYYRLKIMDNDGRYEYSDIIMVVGEESRRIIAYPNPSADFFRLEGLEKDAYNATLTNIFGQKTDIRIEHRQINLKDMPSGIYYLQIREGSATQTLRLVKYAD